MINTIADYFDVIDGQWNQAEFIEEVKKRNSNIIHLSYKAPTSIYGEGYPENWYHHDNTGKKITEKSFGFYLMDAGNQEWRD